MVATSTTEACGPPRMILAREFNFLISSANRNVSGYELQIELNPKTSERLNRKMFCYKGEEQPRNTMARLNFGGGALLPFGTLALIEGRLLSPDEFKEKVIEINDVRVVALLAEQRS